MFCHHVIAVFEHLRLDEIPHKYILKRYCKNAVTDPEFNRRDCKATAPDGTSLEYRRTILYNEAIKTVSRGCSSDAMFDIALAAFREVNTRMDDEENGVNNRNQPSTSEEYPEGPVGSDEVPDNTSAGPCEDILPPPVARTKGSRNKHKSQAPEPAPTRPEPDLDEHGVPKGKRLCSNCNKIAGHNARTCKKRQMAAKLLETHQKVYGTSSPTEKVKLCIKNLLAKQNIKSADDEEILDSDEEEDYEDETDEDEQQDKEEDEDIHTGSDSERVEEDDEHTNDAHDSGPEEEADEDTEMAQSSDADDSGHVAQADKIAKLPPEKPEGQRTCSICGERTKHNARTCPNKTEILQMQLEERQRNGPTKMTPQGKRICSICNKIRGHNARTCLRLQLEEQLRTHQLEMESQTNIQNNKTDKKDKKAKAQEDSELQSQPRRSGRLR